MDLETLIERCRTGDPLAWEMLVRRYQGRAFGLAYHYLGNAEEARDLAQEIFVRIYERLASCTSAETFVPWMIRIGRNLCIDRLRRRRARPQAVTTPVEEMVDLAADAPGPATDLERGARRDLVQRAIARLSDVNREVILLKEIEGLTLQEIAEMLGVPIGTVKSRSNRARIALADEVRLLLGGSA
ncbi:MAG: sigma-70 family RNA polymerase sigma factor [Candidatus Eisenbacteria bacterium]|nr:sigma-70 family RNA polymerase sigma factor [Candidatus Eisenbacteria bacterium]